MTQICTACGEEKVTKDFTLRRDSGKHRTQCKPCRSLESQAGRYGLGREEVIALLANACCEICGDVPTHAAFVHTSGLVIDHCHSSGKVRGVLCAKCNSGLGLFKDDPVRLLQAVEYLNGTMQ